MSRRLFGSGCASKMLYRSRKLALKVAGETTRRGAPKLYAYHCHPCHGYHLTSWSPVDRAAHEALRESAERRP